MRRRTWTKVLKFDILKYVFFSFFPLLLYFRSYNRLNYSTFEYEGRLCSRGTRPINLLKLKDLAVEPLKMEMGGKHRPTVTLAFLFSYCEPERFNWPWCFPSLFVGRLSLTFQPRRKSLNGWGGTWGEGEERGIKRYFLRITVAILKG